MHDPTMTGTEGVEQTPVVPTTKRKRVVGTWARYAVCGVCKQIMSMKIGKVVQVNEGVFIHKNCGPVFAAMMRKEMEKREKAAKIKALNKAVEEVKNASDSQVG